MNTLYFIECSYGRLGNAFRETDRDSNFRNAALGLIRSGEISAIKVLEVNEDAGTVRDCTNDEDFADALFGALVAAG